MKKIILASSIASLLLMGCSSTNSTQSLKDVNWKYSRDLPTPKGYEKQIGVAGPLAGNIGDYIVVAGGANFPHKSVLEGGPKVTYSDLYLMKQTNKGLELIKHTQLPKEIGYGTAISTENGIYYIGGTHQKGISNEILYLTLNKDKTDIEINKIGELPFDYHSGVAVLKDNNIYIVTGRQNGQNSKNFYKYDLATNKTSELKMFPGTERSQSIGQILNNGKEDLLYVFGGGTGIAFTDGYAYNFNKNTWEKVQDVKLGTKDISVLGANSIKLNINEMMVIGGFNKEIWDDANLKLGGLKGEELAKYKNSYFTKDPQDFNWNQDMLVYNAKDNTWKSAGKVPFLAPCGEGLVKIDNKIYSINGEIKPGVRSEKIYVGTIEN
ncbi:cyclically-permuted mutarotase family protein [Cetobacterium sp. 8H]|uniref:cyclically-permuted mutarotase family protein n=1 Tax=Cetobacterium sp. 8H TaxID=2759681 RepID=UPI00163BD53F|nr:cyclically-permuted mutarotase family protein [Cetobacterium sp. 8H]MBC2850240.1 cyclically-permuted mutarotase family protein [Cetobacterium sp. 8H]